MNILKAALGLTVVTILNIIYVKHFTIMDVVPNLMIIVIVMMGLKKGRTIGALSGIFVGVLNDIFAGQTFGISALIYMYIGYMAGSLSKKLYNENVIISAVIVCFANLLYNMSIYCYYYFPKDYSLWNNLIHITLPEIIYTVMFFVIINFIIIEASRQMNRSF